MQPYEFVPGTGALVEQPDSSWVAEFEATIYDRQVYVESSNTVDPNNVRVIEFEVTGDELHPLENQFGACAPYVRGSEIKVELVLTRDGKRKGSLTMHYP